MYKNILLTIDLGNREAETKAVAAAIELARAGGSTLHVMTVVPDYGMSIVGGFFPKGHEQQAVGHANDELHAFVKASVPADIRHRHIVGHGSIYQQILHYADVTRADLIVLSASRPGLEDYLIGPNAARVVRHSRTSVLVVR